MNIYIFLFFLTIFQLVAQDKTEEVSKSYSYQDIVKKTLKHNNKLKELKEQIVQADILIEKSYTFLQPIWDFGGRFTINNKETAMDFPDFSSGMPPKTNKVVINEKYAWEINSTVKYTLLNLRSFPLIKVAKEMKRVKILSLKMAKIEIKNMIAQLYLNALTLKEAIKVKKTIKKNLQEHLKYIEEKLKLNDALDIEKTRFEIEIATTEIDIKKLEGSLKKIKSGLAVLMGEDNENFSLTPLSFKVDTLSLNRLFSKAKNNRIEAKLNTSSLKIEKLMLKNIYMKFFPTVFLQAAWKYGNSANLSGDKSSWNISFLLNFPIYDGGIRYKEFAEERSKIRALKYKIKQFNEDLKNEIKGILIDLDNLDLTIKATLKQKLLVEKNLKQVEEAYKLGVRKYIDVLDASHNLQMVSNNLVIQKLNKELLYLKLKKALGDI